LPVRPVVGSCSDCQHYGWLAYRWRCGACESWNRSHPRGNCSGCDRVGVAVSRQHCRGCWKQAAYLAEPLNTDRLLSPTSRFPHHQLALAGLRHATPGVRRGRPVRRPRQQDAKPDVVSGSGQLPLFPLVPALWKRRPRRTAPPAAPISVTTPSGRPVILNAFWIAQQVDEYGRARGWSPALRCQAWAAVTEAFTDRFPQRAISRSDLRLYGGPTQPIADALAHLGLLIDPADPLPELLARRTAGLPPGMAADLTVWITVLRDGGVRRRPRSWKTVTEYSGRVRPLLMSWARRHQHLREVSAQEVRQALFAQPPGSARRNVFVAARSLFGFLHRDGRLFTNPAVGIHLGTRQESALLPLTERDYQRLVTHATSELHRAVLVLTAVHGARPHALRALRLTDLDLGGGRLQLCGVSRQLDDLGVAVLADWLSYRRRTWPLTANPHLLISAVGALTDRPISRNTLAGLFHGSGITLDRLRMDRHLEEALAYGPDPLHLAGTFGVSKATGIRYASHAKQLLADYASPPCSSP